MRDWLSALANNLVASVLWSILGPSLIGAGVTGLLAGVPGFPPWLVVFAGLGVGLAIYEGLRELRVRRGLTFRGISKHVDSRTFRHERIELDGTQFSHCKFIECTWIYRGHARWAVIDSEVEGDQHLELPPGPTAATGDFLQMLKATTEDFNKKWEHKPEDYFRRADR